MKNVLRKTKAALASVMSFLVVLTMVPLFPMTVLADGPEYTVDFGAGVYQVNDTTEVSILKIGDTDFVSPFNGTIQAGTVITLSDSFDPATMEVGVSEGEGGFSTELVVNEDRTVKFESTNPGANIPTSGLSFYVKVRENNPGPAGNGLISFRIDGANEALVFYSLDGTNWYLVDADKSQEQYQNNVNFSEVTENDLANLSKIYVKVQLNGQEFDDFVNQSNNYTNIFYELRQGEAMLLHTEIDRDALSSTGVEVPYEFNSLKNDSQNLDISIRFKNGGGSPGFDFNYIVSFGEGSINGNVVTYTIDDKEVTLTVEGATIENGKLKVESSKREQVKFTTSGFQSNKMRIMSNDLGVNPPNGQDWFYIRELGSPSEEEGIEYNVTLEIIKDDPNSRPVVQEKPTIKLLGESGEIVIMNEGEEVTKVDGISISYDNGTPVLTLSGCNREIETLEISNTRNVRLRVDGENKFFGIKLGAKVNCEVDVDNTAGSPDKESIGRLVIGNDAIKGEGDDNEINFTGDLILDLKTSDNAFSGFNKVRFTNYEFHSREKTNNIIYAEGFGFKGVGRVEIYSTKAEFAVGKLTDEMIPVVVCQEGQIKVVGSPEAADFRSRYYESYPGDGGPVEDLGHDLEAGDNMDEVNIFDANMSEAARASFEQTDGDSFILKSLDPILYSVSYQVDAGIRESGEFGDPDAGELFMNGFKKGFWTKDGTGGKFEAWIAAGETVNVTILPNSGYQYIKNTLNINGMNIDTTPGENVGTYSFVMGPHAGHICAGFIKTDDVVEVDNSLGIKNAAVQAEDGVVESGNVKLTISKANPSEADMNKIKAAADVEDGKYVNLDLDVNEYVVKNYDPNATKQEAWESDLPGELAGKVTIGIEVPQDVDLNSRYEVVRLHNGKAERLDVTYLGEDKMIAFETDKFSTYSIVYTPLVILDGNNQEIDGSKDITIRSNGDFKEFVGLLMDRTTPVPENCYEKKEGSTIVILKHDYLETLPDGPHRLTFVYNDGEVSADFTLKKTSNTSGSSGSSSSGSGATAAPVKDSVPKTGENNTMLIVLMILSGASLLGMGYAVRSLRKKE